MEEFEKEREESKLKDAPEDADDVEIDDGEHLSDTEILCNLFHKYLRWT